MQSGCPHCGADAVEDITWSEWQYHLWCYKCQKDYIPKDRGVLNGDIIPMETTALLLGVTWDIVDLKKEVPCGMIPYDPDPKGLWWRTVNNDYKKERKNKRG